MDQVSDRSTRLTSWVPLDLSPACSAMRPPFERARDPGPGEMSVSLVLVDEFWSSVEMIGNQFVGHGKFQNFLVFPKPPHDLHTHGSALLIETNGHVDHRKTS